MRHILTGLALLATTGAAAQDCPVAADLTGGGIEFTTASGAVEVFTRFSPGIVTSVYTEDGYAGRALLGKGYYLLELIDVEDGALVPDTRSTYAYPEGPLSGPEPQPGLTWQVEALVRDPGAGPFDIRREGQIYRFGAAEQKVFGACSYEVIEIQVAYTEEREGTIDFLHYFPALGFSYFAGSQDAGDAEPEMYVYTSMRRLP